MANKIQFLRGPQANINELQLAFGQPAFTDAGKLYIGNSDGSSKTLINEIPSGDIVSDGLMNPGENQDIRLTITTQDEFELKPGASVIGFVSGMGLVVTGKTFLNVNETGDKEIAKDISLSSSSQFEEGSALLFILYNDKWYVIGDVKEYRTISSGTASEGTNTIGMLISAKVLADYVTERMNTLGSAAAKDVGTSEGQIPVLGVNGKLPTSMFDDALLGNVKYMGTWDASTNTPTLEETPTDPGHYYIVSTAGSFASIDFNVGDWIIANGDTWAKVDNTDAVSSVAGLTGVITVDQLATAGLEKALPTGGTANQFLDGTKKWVDFDGKVRAATLTGLATSTNAAVAETDSVLVAIGKLQAQINAGISAGDVMGATLEGYQAGANTALATTDTVLSAMGKIQGQINARLVASNIKQGTNVSVNASGNDVTIAVADATDSVKGVTTVGATGGAEAYITPGTATQYMKGDKSWGDFASDVLSTQTTELTLTNAAIATGDSVLVALGKLQAQVNDKTKFTSADVLATTLTGYSKGANTALDASDTVLAAMGKIQGQVEARAPLADPAFTGVPTAPTAAKDTNTTQVATTAFVVAQGYLNADSVIDGGTF